MLEIQIGVLIAVIFFSVCMWVANIKRFRSSGLLPQSEMYRFSSNVHFIL